MKKFTWLTILTALILALGCLGAAFAEIIPAAEPGQQIGYQAVVLCETLTLRESSSSSSKALQTLNYGDLPIVVGVNGCLVRPAVDQENGLRVIQRLKILIAQIARFLSDAVRNPGFFHFFRERPGSAVGTFVVKIHCNHFFHSLKYDH